ncbi:hypothetical protein M569_08236, partial [Genlisea aurea]
DGNGGNGNDGGGGNRGEIFLKNLNRNSHRIGKPVRKPLPPQAAAVVEAYTTVQIMDPNPQNPGAALSQQPPVYNINKNDFRDVVQKLTGSPAHERLPSSSPPPPAPPPQPLVSQTRPSSSRLQRIRPPPLVQISSRPQLTQILPRPIMDAGARAPSEATQFQQQQQLFTPLPPLPSVHTAAESPISAYMRFLHNSNSSTAQSPLWNTAAAIVPQNEFGQRPSLQPMESPVSAYLRLIHTSNPSSQPPPPLPALPPSPVPFGCAPSPSFLLSPTGQLGLPQLPLSPTLPLPSPR